MNNSISSFTNNLHISDFKFANVLTTVGNAITTAFQWIITNVSKIGLNVSALVAKLIAIFVIGLVIYFIAKFASKIWKVLLWILFIIIVACIGYTFFI